MKNILENDIDFQKEENQFNTLIAGNKIERSINWFYLNLAYRKTSNDIIRDQTKDRKLEHSALMISKKLKIKLFPVKAY